MSVAVENLITNLRKKNAEDEAKRISMEERNAIDRKRKSDKLQAAEKKTLDALDKFKESLSRGKKTKAGEVIASRLSEAEKEQVSVLNESVKAAQEDLKFNSRTIPFVLGDEKRSNPFLNPEYAKYVINNIITILIILKSIILNNFLQMR